jgi:hypothetical protein
MVPVDGGLTLSHTAMTGIAQRLQSSILLPMHRRGAPLSSFIEMMGDNFVTDFVNSDRLYHFGARTLPRRPTILVLQGRLIMDAPTRPFLASVGLQVASPRSPQIALRGDLEMNAPGCLAALKKRQEPNAEGRQC